MLRFTRSRGSSCGHRGCLELTCVIGHSGDAAAGTWFLPHWKSDLCNHRAIVQPRSLLLQTQSPPTGSLSDRGLRRLIRHCLVLSYLNRLRCGNANHLREVRHFVSEQQLVRVAGSLPPARDYVSSACQKAGQQLLRKSVPGKNRTRGNLCSA